MAAAMARVGGFFGLFIEGSGSDYAKIGRDFVPDIAKPFFRLKVSQDLKMFNYFGFALASKTPTRMLCSIDFQIISHCGAGANLRKMAATKAAKVGSLR